jgi:hypothetical protein
VFSLCSASTVSLYLEHYTHRFVRKLKVKYDFIVESHETRDVFSAAIASGSQIKTFRFLNNILSLCGQENAAATVLTFLFWEQGWSKQLFFISFYILKQLLDVYAYLSHTCIHRGMHITHLRSFTYPDSKASTTISLLIMRVLQQLWDSISFVWLRPSTSLAIFVRP